MCECRNTSDLKNQKRLVRIVSVFLTFLIKSKIINFNTDMIMNIQQFCLDFSKVPEANTLQKLVIAENYQKMQTKK